MREKGGGFFFRLFYFQLLGVQWKDYSALSGKNAPATAPPPLENHVSFTF